MLEQLRENFSAERAVFHTLKLGSYCTLITSGPLIFITAIEIIQPSIYSGTFEELLEIIPRLAIFGFSGGGAIAIATESIEAGIKAIKQRKYTP